MWCDIIESLLLSNEFYAAISIAASEQGGGGDYPFAPHVFILITVSVQRLMYFSSSQRDFA